VQKKRRDGFNLGEGSSERCHAGKKPGVKDLLTPIWSDKGEQVKKKGIIKDRRYPNNVDGKKVCFAAAIHGGERLSTHHSSLHIHHRGVRGRGYLYERGGCNTRRRGLKT